MSMEDYEIFVKALDKEWKLEEFELEVAIEILPEGLTNYEIGGITDPIGQLINWLWNQIQGAFDSLANTVWNFLVSIRDAIINSVSTAIDNAVNVITSGISNLVSGINNILSALDSYMADAIDTLSNIGNLISSGLSQLYTSISNLVSQIQDILSSIVSSIVDAVTDTLTNLADLITSGFTNIVNAIQDILTHVGDTLREIGESISASVSQAISNLISGLESMLNNLSNILNSLVSQISASFTNLFTTLQNIASGIISTVSEGFKNLVSIMQNILTDVMQTLTNFMSSIASAIQTAFTNLMNWIQNALSTFAESISSVLASLSNTLNNIFTAITGAINQLGLSIQNILNNIVNAISGAFQNIYNALSSVATAITGAINSMLSSIQDALSNLANQILSGINGMIKGIQDAIGNFVKTIQSGLDDLKKRIDEVSKDITQSTEDMNTRIGGVESAIQGFINAILKFPEWFPKWFEDYISNPIKSISDIFANIGETLSNIGESLVQFVTGGIEWLNQNIVQPALTWLSNALNTLWNIMQQIGETVIKGTMNFLNTLSKGLLELGKSITVGVNAMFIAVAEALQQVVTAPAKALSGLLKWAIDSMMISVSEYITGLITKSVGKVGQKGFLEKRTEDWIKGVALGLELSGGGILAYFTGQMAFRTLQWYLKGLARWLWQFQAEAEGEGSAEPVGVGAKGGLRFRWNIALGGVLWDLAEDMTRWVDIITNGIMYGFAIWYSQPLSRLLTYWVRNQLPVQLPDLHTLEEITRRVLPTDKTDELIEISRYYMGLYGYPDYVIDWYFTPPDQFSIKIKDRFNKERLVPLSLIYRHPTPSDLVRMMIHDIIIDPEYFKQIMYAKGYYPDISYMYYLLHYRYPPPEKLWLFYARAKANMLWFDPEKFGAGQLTESEKKLVKEVGAFEPVPPAKLNITRPEIEKQILNAFTQYMKWHDYAPFSWTQNFTSDRWIMMDLMADIPMRIDARWMYKWSIIDDETLKRIVTARGMHPDWVEPIAISEMLNAVQEERTYVRSGIVSTYKEGFMTQEKLTELFNNLTTVTILGKEVPVKFLPSEQKLLVLRASYDRALDILRDYARQLIKSGYENIITYDNITKLLKKLINAIGESLNLPISLDESYWKLYKPVVDTQLNIYTVGRVRTWIRYMMYRILTRFSQGYMSKSEVQSIVNELVEAGKLTDAEKKLLLDIAEWMLDFFKREALTKAILKKLQRGRITREEAVQELKKLGLDDDTIDAFVEEYVKTYTLSIATLLSYASVIAVPEDLLKKKMDLLGVPDDEKELILQVFKIRPIKDEISRVVSRLLDAFEDGTISEDTFRDSLKKLGKRDIEINLLVEAGKIRKYVKTASYMVDAILNKLEKGLITPDEAKAQIMKYIKDENLVNALIEKHLKIYTFSVDKLISMGEYVPIDIEKVIEKAKKFGYPEDEAKLLPAYKIARDISEEMGRVVTELITDYANGLLTRDQLSDLLDDLRTLGGQVKKLGVDWIVIDDLEKDILMYLAELRRRRYMARRG